MTNSIRRPPLNEECHLPGEDVYDEGGNTNTPSARNGESPVQIVKRKMGELGSAVGGMFRTASGTVFGNGRLSTLNAGDRTKSEVILGSPRQNNTQDSDLDDDWEIVNVEELELNIRGAAG